MMFYGDGDQVTLDSNYFHDVSGRAPKLGEDGVSGTFQASNNYFANMLGHAFDAYDGASAIIEGNVFDTVTTPMTSQAETVSTLYNVPDSSAASACSSVIGRACEVNSLTGSGDMASMSSSSALTAFKSIGDYLVTPIAASAVKANVLANYGPANLASYSGHSSSGGSTSSGTTTAVASKATATTKKTSSTKAAAATTSAKKAATTTSAAKAATTSTAKKSTSTKAVATKAVAAAAASSSTAEQAAPTATGKASGGSGCSKRKRAYRQSLRA
jgi:pectin lyase